MVHSMPDVWYLGIPMLLCADNCGAVWTKCDLDRHWNMVARGGWVVDVHGWMEPVPRRERYPVEGGRR